MIEERSVSELHADGKFPFCYLLLFFLNEISVLELALSVIHGDFLRRDALLVCSIYIYQAELCCFIVPNSRIIHVGFELLLTCKVSDYLDIETVCFSGHATYQGKSKAKLKSRSLYCYIADL